MNLPDITLLFQIVHFAIVYLVLRNLVFVPALRIIEQKEREQHDLQASVDAGRLQYQEITQNKEQRLQQLKQKLIAMVPEQAQAETVRVTDIDLQHEAPQATKLSSNSKSKVSQILIQELSNVEV